MTIKHQEKNKVILKIFAFLLFISSVILLAFYMISRTETSRLANHNNLVQLSSPLLEKMSTDEMLLEILAIARPLNEKTGLFEVLPGFLIMNEEFIPQVTLEGKQIADQKATEREFENMREIYRKLNRIDPAFVSDLSNGSRGLKLALVDLPHLGGVYSVYHTGKFHENLPMLASFFGCAFTQAYRGSSTIVLNEALQSLFQEAEFAQLWQEGQQSGNCLPEDTQDRLKFSPDLGRLIENSRNRDPGPVLKKLWQANVDIFTIQRSSTVWSGIIFEYLQRMLQNGEIKKEELTARAQKAVNFKFQTGAMKSYLKNNLESQQMKTKAAIEYRLGLYETAISGREKLLMNIPDLTSITEYINKNAFAVISFEQPAAETEKQTMIPVPWDSSVKIFTNLPRDLFPPENRKNIQSFQSARECENCVIIDSDEIPLPVFADITRRVQNVPMITFRPERAISDFQGTLIATFADVVTHPTIAVQIVNSAEPLRTLYWPGKQ